jgi:glutamate racemase
MTDGPLRALIFDSGLGGLSVFREVSARLPGLACVYAADTAFFPYGTKPEEDLVRRLPRLMAALAARYRPDIAVIACNTASTIALPPIRVALSVPVVGTVPARAYTDRLIDQFAADCRVLRHGSAELVALAEAKLRRGRVRLDDVRAAVAPLLSDPGADPAAGDMDVVVLACTHFPLLAEELRASFPPGVALIDSGEAIARRVADLLDPGDARQPAPRHIAVVTSQTPDLEGSQDYLADAGFARIDLFDEARAATATVA